MRRKVLIIDDEQDVVLMMVYRLKAAQFEIKTAITGQEGIDIAQEYRPDIILLDYRLPDMGAQEIMRGVKAIEGLDHVVMILVTASTQDIEEKIQQCQAQDFIFKPVDPGILVDKIQKSFQ